MVGRFDQDIFGLSDKLCPKTDIMIRLYPALPEFQINTAIKDKEFIVEVQKAELMVKKIDVTNQPRNASLNFLRNEIRTFTIPSGLTMWQGNVYEGQLPKRMLIGLVDQEAYLGNYGKNPLNFQNKDVSAIQIDVNGHPYPKTALKCDFDKLQHNLAYTFVATELSDTDYDLSALHFGQGYTLWAFNVADVVDEDEGQVRLSLEFKVALDKPVIMLVYLERDRTMNIDQYGSVSME